MNKILSLVCKICGESFQTDTRSTGGEFGRSYEQLMTEMSDISGRSLSHVISNVFPKDDEIQDFVSYQNETEKQVTFTKNDQNEGACGTCCNLLEQIEAFMLNSNRSKVDLFNRRRNADNLNQNSMSVLTFNEQYRGIQPNGEYAANNQSNSNKRAELLSQLPASTKVTSVRTMKPKNIFQPENIAHQYNLLMAFKSSNASFTENTEPNVFLDSSMGIISSESISNGQEKNDLERDENKEANETLQNDTLSDSCNNLKTEPNFELDDNSIIDQIDKCLSYKNGPDNELEPGIDNTSEQNETEDVAKIKIPKLRNSHKIKTKKMKKPRKKKNVQEVNNDIDSLLKKYKKNVFITCEHCGKKSRGEKFHAKHLFTTHGLEKKVLCRQCGKECLSIRDLDHHRRTNHIVASCEHCARPFYNPADLDKHLKNVHLIGQKEDEFICELCAQKFQTKQYLRVHMRVHRDRNIKCTLCDKAFRWESGLKSHMAAAHSQLAQLYNCDFCGKQFKDKGNWKSHRYTHLDYKPHSCSKCKKGFIRKDVLLTHEKNCKL